MSNTAVTTKSTQTTTNEVFTDIVDKYAKADKGDKARIRTNTDKKFKQALRDGDAQLATKYLKTLDALKSDNSPKEVNHGQIVAKATFFADVLNRAIAAYVAEHDIKGDLPKLDNSDMEAMTAKADKLAKSLFSVRSDARDIQGVFDRAFANSDKGDFLLVSDICDKGALPDYKPGSGAVAARLTVRADGTMHLNSDTSLEGYEPVWITASGTVHTNSDRSANTDKLGARKI